MAPIQFSFIKKIKIGYLEHLMPPTPTPDNISFLPYTPTPFKIDIIYVLSIGLLLLLLLLLLLSLLLFRNKNEVGFSKVIFTNRLFTPNDS